MIKARRQARFLLSGIEQYMQQCEEREPHARASD
jgi:hypothetical protein